ncbi:hypothetical protein DB345_02510 [Spartobacteria bacterium LR76]|nr:hypothetical protein DB345_02510 [Spartobacteria bacterium LR76]
MKPFSKILKVKLLELGDYVAIPRLDGRYVHARIYKGAVGIFSGRHDEPQSLERLLGKTPKKFYYYCSLPGGRYQKDWVFIGRVPFEDAEAMWPPAMSTTDGIYKTKPQVYWKGGFMDVTEEELKGKQPWIVHGFTALQEVVSGTYKDPWKKLRRRPADSPA